MKFSTSFFILAASLTSALPSRRWQGTAGSLYFMNNNETDNQLIIHDIMYDGSIEFVGSVSTGGKGAHGLLMPDQGQKDDALFSQGPIRIDGNFLYAVNPGSDTVSMFEIDPHNPSAPKLVNTIWSGGNWPVSIAVHPKTGAVCVLNGGENNGVACFNVDSAKGLISMTDSMRTIGLRQTTPASGVPGTVSDLQFTEDGNKLVAAVKGIPGANMTSAPMEKGFLAVWDVSELDDCESVNLDAFSVGLDYNKATLPMGSLLPFSLTPIPGKNAFIGSDAAVGGAIFIMNEDGSVDGSAIPIANQSANCWSVYSPMTKNFYLTDTGTSQVNEISVDENLQGKLVNQYQLKNGSRLLDDTIVTINNTDYLYVLAPTYNLINVLALTGPGSANNFQNYDYGTPASQANIDVTQYNVVGLAAFVKSN